MASMHCHPAVGQATSVRPRAGSFVASSHLGKSRCPIVSRELRDVLSSKIMSGLWMQAAKKRQGLVVARGQPGLLNLPLARDLEEPISGFDSIGDALKDLAAGKFLVVIDDEDRENEGDLIIAADKVTTASMAYMVEYTSGVLCIAMEGKDLDRLRLPLMVSSAENEEAMYTAFTITVDLKEGITTGISAEDRAKTLRHMANPEATAIDFRRPGHIFPLRYRAGGVLVRPGHTEASVDLARLAGCFPAGVLCEIVNKEDGSMSRTPQLLKYAKEHGLKCITIADLIRYRLRHEKLVTLLSSSPIQSRHGPLTAHTFASHLDGSQHIVLTPSPSQNGTAAPLGSSAQNGPVPVHVHREQCVLDILGEPFPSAPPPSSHSSSPSTKGVNQDLSLDAALQRMCAAGQGAVVYLRQRLDGEPTPSEELKAKAESSSKMSQGGRTNVSQNGLDLRAFGLAAQMLKELGVGCVEVMSGDQGQADALTSCGLKVQGLCENGSEGGIEKVGGGSKGAVSNGVGNGVAHTLAGASR